MIDFHCHLDLYPDPMAVVRRCQRDGTYVLSVTTTPKAWRGTLSLANGIQRIRTALGLHPQLAHERLGELPLFEGLLSETKYVGEIGLDGSPDHRPHWREQLKAFDTVLRATATAGGRIMTIHSRRAPDEVMDALRAHPDAGTPVLHWFTGNKTQLERAIATGCWFSVGPAMLQSKRGAELVAAMPRDRVLTETDGPFGMTQNRPLEPSDVTEAVTMLGRIWNQNVGEVRHRIRDNLRSLTAAADA
jgi:TatD DNase family protein